MAAGEPVLLWLNTILTILSLYVVYWILSHIDWAGL
jgi:hypothetical protein